MLLWLKKALASLFVNSCPLATFLPWSTTGHKRWALFSMFLKQPSEFFLLQDALQNVTAIGMSGWECLGRKLLCIYKMKVLECMESWCCNALSNPGTDNCISC